MGEDPAGQADPSYLEVARRLMGSARDLVGAHAADDLVFDTMSTLLPRWDRITGDKVAYARRSMVNRFRDQGRHLRVEAAHRHTFVTPDREEPANDRVASRLDLSAVLHLLPERTRQVLVLRYQLDLSAADLAVILGMPAGSVRRVAHDGLRALSDIIEPASEGTAS
ncbi:sigma-70 family RNA polymerase sigma factor [Nakamurella sp. A5-74]|uniref:Sigma-70 family RNA polymerase sigma factor n=1 Tax=Nakamurella sp. A5-74 TaxID=3158264 RepID=A0AAU8DSL6_9ACTN